PLQAISRDGVDRPHHGSQLVRRVLVGNARALMKVFTHADKAVDVLVGHPSVVIGPGGSLESHFAVRLARRERAERNFAGAHQGYAIAHTTQSTQPTRPTQPTQSGREMV